MLIDKIFKMIVECGIMLIDSMDSKSKDKGVGEEGVRMWVSVGCVVRQPRVYNHVHKL